MTTRLSDDDLDQLLAEATPPTPSYSPPGHLADQIVCKERHSRLRSFHDWCAHAPRGLRLAVAPGAVAVAAVALLVAGQQAGRSLETADAATIVLNRAAEATLRIRDLPPGRLRYARDTEN